LTVWTGEAEPGHPYWWDDRSASPDPAIEPPAKADILIIGGGYTGLAAAIAAHDAGASVVVVDAGIPGQAASTRNGGMFGAHPRLGWEALAASFGAKTADALFAEANPAMRFVKDLITREGIDCDLQATGRISLAWTAAHLEGLKKLAGHVQAKSDVKVTIVERRDLTAEIATERYFGGLLFPEHCAINPRKFHSGLLAAVRSRGVAVCANTPVTQLRRDLSGFHAIVPNRTIRADKIILATNGYTPSLFRWHQRRVFPLPSFLIATEELPQQIIDQIAPGRRMMVETRARHSYWRVSPDSKRVLFGGRASMRNIPLALVAERLRTTMCDIWPTLNDTRLSHVWTGNTGFSFSHMPSVGENDGVHYAFGFSGSGTVMAPYLGTKVGLRAVGVAGGATAYADAALRTRWLHPFTRPHFLYAADLWYRNWVDRKEWRQRRDTH